MVFKLNENGNHLSIISGASNVPSGSTSLLCVWSCMNLQGLSTDGLKKLVTYRWVGIWSDISGVKLSQEQCHMLEWTRLTNSWRHCRRDKPLHASTLSKQLLLVSRYPRDCSVRNYELYTRGSINRGGIIFFSPPRQNQPLVPSSLLSNTTGSLFPGLKRPRYVADHSRPSSFEFKCPWCLVTLPFTDILIPM